MSNKPEIICLGEALIDIIPTVHGASLEEGTNVQIHCGGAPANVAVALARLGTPVGFVGKVGQDLFGKLLSSTLASNNVNIEQLRFSKEVNTGVAFVNWDRISGEANYLFYRNPSADTLLDVSDIDANYFGQAKLLQFGSLLLAAEPSGSATIYALQLAVKLGLLLSYDLNLRIDMWPDEATLLSKIEIPLSMANIIKLNRHELSFITGEPDPVAGTTKIWRSQFKLIIVTLDSEGCFYRTATDSGFVSSFKVQEVVDTVGAGDGFMAGILDELRLGNFDFENIELIRRACRKASAVGAITVTRAGGIPALPTLVEVNNFLQMQAEK